MNKHRRSTTGCTLCKQKRKKCDEGKPRCQRCTTSGIPCSYEYIKHQETTTHLIQRTKPAPRPPSESLAKASRNISTTLESATASFPVHSAPENSPRFVCPATCRDPNPVLSTEETVGALAVFAIPPVLDPCFHQISPWDTLSSFFAPEVGFSSDTGVHILDPGIEGLTQPDDDLAENIKDQDPEGIRPLLCIVPTMDRNVKENSLPFVLQCYSQWAIMFVFEPLEVVHVMREDAIAHFSSEDTRLRTILVANAMRMFSSNPQVSPTGMSLVTHLASKVREEVRTFMATPPPSALTLDRKNAMHALDNSLEVMTLQINTCSLATCIQLMDDAAPVFRRACSEPPGQPLNLVNILLGPSLNLRHFVSLDIMGGVTNARPTHFKYEVAYSTELCERMFQLQKPHGLQWLHGLPDQFIMILAWINSYVKFRKLASTSS
ncbi:unnamed protein product [Rhizoctonia solani]|uniref:Zn(2)-C6 fungal-type domain-containing protein n=1 Tax=Rhizoctonia solani TaxID=456999 RepID=A0A8H2WQM1_9AGAM|nr:unnamed protein product [Rhizoctonia solani]